MPGCEHPAPDEVFPPQKVAPGMAPGEYRVDFGSVIAQGPLPEADIKDAGRLSQEETGEAAFASVPEDPLQCGTCGDWWSSCLIRPARPDDNPDDNLLTMW